MKQKNYKKLLLAAAVVFIVAVSVGVWWLLFYPRSTPLTEHTKPSSTPQQHSYVNEDEPTADQKAAGNTAKEDSINTSDPSSSGGPRMDITAASQSGATLSVRVIIYEVRSSGTCRIEMTGPNSKTYRQSVDIQPLPSSTTCKGFDIPMGSLSGGKWSINVTYDDTSVQAKASREINLQ